MAAEDDNDDEDQEVDDDDAEEGQYDKDEVEDEDENEDESEREEVQVPQRASKVVNKPPRNSYAQPSSSSGSEKKRSRSAARDYDQDSTADAKVGHSVKELGRFQKEGQATLAAQGRQYNSTNLLSQSPDCGGPQSRRDGDLNIDLYSLPHFAKLALSVAFNRVSVNYHDGCNCLKTPCL